MKAVVSALLVLSLVFVIGCENDENTVEPIPKYHNVYPVFHLKIDNGFRAFGVDSTQLIPSPGIGWPEPVYTDENGFVGALASGTFIDRIDTITDGDSTYIDTSYLVFGFQPAATYEFSFNRSEPFIWLDSFRADYAITVESLWVLFSADTVEVTTALDPGEPPVTVLDRVVENPAPGLFPPPDDTIIQDVLYGFWFDSAFVITNPDDTMDYPPDSAFDSTIIWGLWHRIDSFFIPPDSSIFCSYADTSVVEETLYDIHEIPSIVIDTVIAYDSCEARIDSLQERIYEYFDWGVYPGGDEGETPIPTFDTTIHFTFPDTAKSLVFGPSGVSIMVPESIDTISHDTTWRTMGVSIEYIHNNVSTIRDGLTIDLTMPAVEVFPQYDFILKEEPR